MPWGKKPLALVAAREVVHVARLGRAMTERVVTPDVVVAPRPQGTAARKVSVYDRGKLVARVPLVADRSIERPGTLGRIGWYAGRTLDHIWGWIS